MSHDSSTDLWGLCGAALVGLGLFGTFFLRSPLRRVVALNLVGAGIFLLFGVIARRGGGAAQAPSDPVPQAMVITGIVVAFAGTTLALALIRRLAECADEAEVRPSSTASTETTRDEEGDRR